ncbi:hypothetical protein EJB05_42276, partial [Eragrostis curvula]
MAPPPRLPVVLLILLGLLEPGGGGMEILSKSRVEKCVRDSDTGGNLACAMKLVVDVAVPNGASGGEASLVGQVAEVEGNATAEPTTLRFPPVITINKSSVYAAYALTYLRDVAYRPEEQMVETRKCEPDAGADVVQQCERFHVFAIGTRSLGFTIRVQVKKGSSVSEVIVGPDNMTVVSGDNFLEVSVIGDFAAYKSMPHYEDTYLVIPRKGEGSGQPEVIGNEYSRWMLLKQSYFTDNGLECNKIGYQWEAACSISFGPIWRSPGTILGCKVPTFEALSQIGVANVTTSNVGQLEASYSLTFKCLSGIADVEEQSYVMKPDEVTSRIFNLHTSTDKAENHTCTAILKDANFSEADRKPCQFSTTSTVLNNGTQIGPPIEHKKKGGIMGLFEDVKAFFRWIWDSVVAFFTGTLCRKNKCSSIFDFRCHFQNICVSWMIMSSVLFLATVLPVATLLWMMHERGFFNHLYDWWKDLLGLEPHDGAHMRHRRGHHHRHHHGRHHTHQGHRSEPSHRHHHHHHRHDEHQPDAAEGGHRHRQHEVFLGVHHGDEHKHRRGKEMAALHLDGPSRLHGTDVRERRHHKRHGHGHGHHHLRAE